MTLQKSFQFKNLFDQLEFMANERRVATKALVSIESGSGVGVECLFQETWSNCAFLKNTNEITFSDEDMDVRYQITKDYFIWRP